RLPVVTHNIRPCSLRAHHGAAPAARSLRLTYGVIVRARRRMGCCNRYRIFSAASKFSAASSSIIQALKSGLSPFFSDAARADCGSLARMKPSTCRKNGSCSIDPNSCFFILAPT
ncbi:MAG: hypothetical protein WCY92_14150, partial [Novosphingobium sp.]